MNSAGNFSNQFTRDLLLTFIQFPLLERLLESPQRHSTNPIDRQLAEPHGSRIVSQSAAATGAAFDFSDQRLQLLTQPSRQSRGLVKRREHAFELKTELHFFSIIQHVEPAIARPKEHQPALPCVELAEGFVGGNSGCFAPSQNHLLRDFGRHVGPQPDGSSQQRKLAVVHDHGRIGSGLSPNAFAVLAPTQLTIEAKIMRR